LNPHAAFAAADFKSDFGSLRQIAPSRMVAHKFLLLNALWNRRARMQLQTVARFFGTKCHQKCHQKRDTQFRFDRGVAASKN